MEGGYGQEGKSGEEEGREADEQIANGVDQIERGYEPGEGGIYWSKNTQNIVFERKFQRLEFEISAEKSYVNVRNYQNLYSE